MSSLRAAYPWILLGVSICALWLLLTAISWAVREMLGVMLIPHPLSTAVIVAVVIVWLARRQAERR